MLRKIASISLLAALLSGCATGPNTWGIEVATTVLHGEGSAERGTIALIPVNQEQADSLLYQQVAGRALRLLALQGYQPVNNPSEAKFIGVLTYGIDTGRTSVTSAPVYGQVGGGTTFSSGTVYSGTNRSTFSGYTSTIPQYGVVGSRTYSSTNFTREANLDIFVNNATPGKKVFEVRAKSTGSCGNLTVVAPGLVEGMLGAFPGESGKLTRLRIDVPEVKDC